MPTETNYIVELLTIAGVILAGVMTPGPDFVASAHSGASGTRKSAFLVVLGISVGSMTWTILSLIGLGVLFSTFAWAYLAVKIAGAAYLIYLGCMMMRSAYCGPGEMKSKLVTKHGWQAFRMGLLTDLSNPKTAVFYTSLFAVVVPQSAPLWQQISIVFTVGIIALSWYGTVALVMGTDRVSSLYKRMERTITGLTGGLLTLLGLKLIADR